MKRKTVIFNFLLIILLSGCTGNSNSTSETEVKSIEIQAAQEAQKDSEAARKSAEATEKEIKQILN